MESIKVFLKSFEKINSGYGVSNEYDFIKIGSCSEDTVQSAIMKYASLSNEDNLSFFELDNWEEQLFSLFPDGEKYWLGSVPDNMDLKNLTSNKYLISLLKSFFLSDFQVYRFEVDKNGYYACSAEEYIFKTSSDIYLLSFQVHD